MKKKLNWRIEENKPACFFSGENRYAEESRDQRIWRENVKFRRRWRDLGFNLTWFRRRWRDLGSTWHDSGEDGEKTWNSGTDEPPNGEVWWNLNRRGGFLAKSESESEEGKCNRCDIHTKNRKRESLAFIVKRRKQK
jgi:hypothetical protein